jgi:hypothetical protein
VRQQRADDVVRLDTTCAGSGSSSHRVGCPDAGATYHTAQLRRAAAATAAASGEHSVPRRTYWDQRRCVCAQRWTAPLCPAPPQDS